MAATTKTDSQKNAEISASLRGEVEAELNFIVPPKDGSAPFVSEGPEGESISGTETRRVHVGDIRGREPQFDLDTHAFKALRNVVSQTTHGTFDTVEEIHRVYYPEVERLLLDNVPGATRVKILGHSVRRENADEYRQPILFVHCDHTGQVAEKFAKDHVSQDGAPEDLLQSRKRIINVWRPLNGPVQTTPMTVLSAASLDKQDLFEVEVRSPPKDLDWFSGIAYNPTQQWFYWSGMDNDERLILKCTDSAAGVAKHAFHSAFVDPRAPPDAKPRESIEVRTLVFG